MTHRQAQLFASIGIDILRSMAIALGIIVITFFLMRMIPGDIVDIRGIEGSLTYSQQTAMRATLGLNKPWISQFFEWVQMLASGNLGLSSRFNVPITSLMATVLPSTLKLGVMGFAFGLVFGIGLPTLACLYPRSPFVWLVEAVTVWSITMPSFSIGIICVLVFAVWLHWIPAIGNLIVPAIILGVDMTGTLSKLLYEDMKDSEAGEYVRMARAKGLSRARVVFRHVLPNALTIVISIMGLLLGGLFTGAITMEVVFGLPGLGTLTLQAIQGRDYPVVQAIIIWLGLAVIFANLITDIVQKVVDPRLRAA